VECRTPGSHDWKYGLFLAPVNSPAFLRHFGQALNAKF
jgi:hypothetical protein